MSNFNKIRFRPRSAPPSAPITGRTFYLDADGVLKAVFPSGGVLDGDVSSLTRVTFTSGEVKLFDLESIGTNSFSGNASVRGVSTPVGSVGAAAFAGCSALTSAVLPEVTSLGDDAFLGCESLTEIALPKVTVMGGTVFDSCEMLGHVYLNCTPNSLGESVFSGTPSPLTIHLRPAPFTPAGWTLGTGRTVSGNTNVTVVADWTTYPNMP